MYTDENYVSRCRERMPALLYFTIVFLSRVGAALCELPLCIPHEPHVSGSRAGYLRRGTASQLTKVSKAVIPSNSQKKHVGLGTRCSHGLGLLPRVVSRFCELMLHVSFTSLTEVRVVRDKVGVERINTYQLTKQ